MTLGYVTLKKLHHRNFYFKTIKFITTMLISLRVPPVPNIIWLLSILSVLAAVVIFMMHRRPRWKPLRYGIADSWELPSGPVSWNGTNRVRAAVEVHVDCSGYFSVRTKVPVQEGQILAEFGGEVHDVALGHDPRPTNWFLSIFGHRGQYVLDGAIHGKWTFFHYLNEGKVASFVNSSQEISGKNNYSDANAVIEWETHESPHKCRAILRAKGDIPAGIEILWNYPWV